MKGRPRRPHNPSGRTPALRLASVPQTTAHAAPAPSSDLLPETVDEWEAFWASPLAGAVDRTTDVPALRRLFWLRDERERTATLYRGERLTFGSTGQLTLSPFGRQLSALDAEIRQLEDRFGLSPTARLRLGIQMGEAKRTLDDLNRELVARSRARESEVIDGDADEAANT